MLANRTRNADGYFVRNANWNSLANGDRLLLAYRNADGVRNLTANVFANIAADGVALSLALRDHGAGGVAHVLGTLFANPVANVVAHGTSAALRNHTASGAVDSTATWLAHSSASRVVDGALTALGNHTASGVVDGAATLFANSAANVVGHRAATALRNHVASRVVNRLATAFWNHLANRIRNALGYAASLVTNTVDFLGFAGWNPNLLANRAWWALYALNMARTWAVDATALRSIPRPRSWCANGAALYRTSDFFADCVPMPAVDRYGACVVDRVGYVANYVTSPGFLLWNHNSVVDFTAVGLLNWVHDGVVDHSFASLNDRLAHCVVDDFAVSFVYRCHDRVVDDLAAGLVYRLLNRVVDDLAVSFVDGLVDRVLDLTSAGLGYRAAYVVGYLTCLGGIDGLVDRVCPSLGLVNWLAYRRVDSAVACFTLHTSNVDYLVFGNRLVLGARALLSLLFVNGAAHGLHHCVCGRATTISNYASAAFVTSSATISGIGFTRGECY